MGFLKKIASQLNEFIVWLWNGGRAPKPKEWCAAFYFCSQEVAGIDYPENTLDAKMADSVASVVAAAGGVKKDVWVAYRTVPSSWVLADPVARVVSVLGPSTDFFYDCYVPDSTMAPLDTEKDLTCFLEWVYRWCPAKHYAIFIWGHSFGPAGLFEPGSEVHIPTPGLAALRRAFERFQATRIAGAGKMTARMTSSSSVSSGSSSGSKAIEEWAKQGDMKVEIVLFLDCWMSTLETAFELAESTERVIASQSLLPVGRDYADFIWPYADLLKLLLRPTFAADMTRRIAQFYVDHYDEVQYLRTIPVALLDLSKVHTLSPLLATLVTKLSNLPDAEQRALLEPARIYRLDVTDPSDPIILCGDGALIDIRTLCATLSNTTWPAGGTTSEQGQAHALATAIGAVLNTPQLVSIATECHAAANSDIGFLGVSAFHWPPRDVVTDDYIIEAVRRSDAAYRSLQ